MNSTEKCRLTSIVIFPEGLSCKLKELEMVLVIAHGQRIEGVRIFRELPLANGQTLYSLFVPWNGRLLYMELSPPTIEIIQPVPHMG